jgi:chaperonin cofactor prefoldin
VVSETQIIALVERFEHKLQTLTNKYADAKGRVDELENEKASLQKNLKEQEDLVQELRKKPVNSEKNTPKSKDVGIIVKDNLFKTDTNAELKQQLDEYIRELERCIAHLSSLS